MGDGVEIEIFARVMTRITLTCNISCIRVELSEVVNPTRIDPLKVVCCPNVEHPYYKPVFTLCYYVTFNLAGSGIFSRYQEVKSWIPAYNECKAELVYVILSLKCIQCR